MNEDIYCDLDLVISDLYELDDNDDNDEISRDIDNVEVSLLKNGGFRELIEYLLDNEEDAKEYQIIRAMNKKLFIKFSDIYATLDYSIKDNKTTNFTVRKFKSFKLGYQKYSDI